MTTPHELVHSATLLCDRLGMPASSCQALALRTKTPDGDRVILNAFTTPAQIDVAVETLICMAAKAKLEINQQDIKDYLQDVQQTFQLNDDDWGELSPYLEELIEAGHANVRHKSAGKYNAQGRHIVLLRTAPGEGGWSPAHAVPSEKAERQWCAAGLDYPASLIKSPLLALENKAIELNRDPLNEMLARRRGLRRKMANIIAEIDTLMPAIRQKNAENALQAITTLIQEIHKANAVTAQILVIRHLVLSTLDAVSADREIDPMDREYELFARAYAEIEHGIGRYQTETAIAQDVQKTLRAIEIASIVVDSLPRDAIGRELQAILKKGLAVADSAIDSTRD